MLHTCGFWPHGRALEYTIRQFSMKNKPGEICHFSWWFKSCKAVLKSLLLYFASKLWFHCLLELKGKIFLFPVNLVPNSSYICSPGAHICSPMGTQVSVVFRGRRIKSNNPPPPNPQTQQDGPLHGITCLFREIVRSMRVNQLLYSNLVGLKKWRIFLFSCECREACLSVSPALPFCRGLWFCLASSAVHRSLPWPCLMGFAFPSAVIGVCF